VTVLFADAVGSTTFTEQAGDEAAYRLVQDCTALMVEAVEHWRTHMVVVGRVLLGQQAETVIDLLDQF